jgi:hypothetical protein
MNKYLIMKALYIQLITSEATPLLSHAQMAYMMALSDSLALDKVDRPTFLLEMQVSPKHPVEKAQEGMGLVTPALRLHLPKEIRGCCIFVQMSVFSAQ